MEALTTLNSRMISMPIENIDTDQIIPARFLKVTDKEGLGANLFSDYRYNEDGTPKPDFILNQEQAQGVQILVAGDNFGCGSSREHAPWALMGFGLKIIISTSFADIFRNNSLKNGLLPVIVDEETHRQLQSLIEEDPDTTVSIDVEKQTLTLPDGRAVSFPLDPFSKNCLINGLDQLGYLRTNANNIEQFENNYATRVNTLG